MRNPSEPSNFANTKRPISQDALDQLFREARTHSAWLPEPVPVKLLDQAYELARLGPTSANGSPVRFVFLTSPSGKARLQPALAPGNVDKTMAAPVTVIIAWDTEFHEKLPRLFPQADMRSFFVGNQPLIHETAFRNSSLQAAYFILAARALGLDCGPMSGFDAHRPHIDGLCRDTPARSRRRSASSRDRLVGKPSKTFFSQQVRLIEAKIRATLECERPAVQITDNQIALRRGSLIGGALSLWPVSLQAFVERVG